MLIVLNLLDIVPGREADYAEYLQRVEPILERYGAKVIVYGQTRMIYMGNCSQEYCGLVAYPDMGSLQALSHDPEFEAVRSLRDRSTTNYVLTVLEGFESLAAAIKHLNEIGG